MPCAHAHGGPRHAFRPVCPLHRQTSPACEDAIEAAGVRKGALDAVLLVGGAARLEAVAEHARSLFGAPPLRMARPEEAVALGAATVAQRLQELEFGRAA